MSHYVCRDHYEPVTWRGTGCRLCDGSPPPPEQASPPPTRDRRRGPDFGWLETDLHTATGYDRAASDGRDGR